MAAPSAGRRADLDRFWELVEAAAVADDVDCEAQADRLTAMLEQLPPEEIVSFDQHFWLRLAEAYRWDLWGLAYQQRFCSGTPQWTWSYATSGLGG
jgi:hypothetical protein